MSLSILNASEKAYGEVNSTSFLKLLKFPPLHSSMSFESIKIRSSLHYRREIISKVKNIL